jgi:hypothetical protein
MKPETKDRNVAARALGIIIVLISSLLLTGCAMFGGQGLKLDIETPDKTIAFKTDYQIENGLRLVRTDEGEYDIELGSATTKDAEVTMMVELMRMMMAIMAAQNGLPPPAIPDDG